MFAAAAACLAADEGGGGAAAAGAQPAMQTEPSADFCGCTKSIPDPLSHVPFRSGCPSGSRGARRAAGGATAELVRADWALTPLVLTKANVVTVARARDDTFMVLLRLGHRCRLRELEVMPVRVGNPRE